MLAAYRSYLLKYGLLRESSFNYDKLVVKSTRICYQDIEARGAIFQKVDFNLKIHGFNWLPQKPVKGELIWIKCSEEINHIYNRGVFLIPINNGICKVGATYNHENLDEIVTEGAKSELIRRLDKLIQFDYEIIGHKAGVRPATIEENPLSEDTQNIKI